MARTIEAVKKAPLKPVLRMLRPGFALMLFVLLTSFFQSLKAAEIPLTILHTNDIHSHFRPNKGRGIDGLGGIARISTFIRRTRETTPNVLVLDGGDWSEGNIYYNLEPGRASIEMMNLLGYDAAALGNHDWLNGPDQLLKVFRQTPPQFAILADNLDFAKYANGKALSAFLPPYKILKIGGLQIGIIGVSTYELIYDKFVSPIAVKDPFSSTRRLAEKLRPSVDFLIVISHNGLMTNKLIAGLPGVDLVIHSHDHNKFDTPVLVERNGKTAMLVEAYRWGAFVGRMDLRIDPTLHQIRLENYKLHQMDASIPEDPAVLNLVTHYEHELETRYGNIFSDAIAESKIDFRREGYDSLYGNLIADSYRDFAHTDVSFEQVSLTSGELYQGSLHSVDIFNGLSAIYRATTQKAWTLMTMKMTGQTLKWLLNFVLSVLPEHKLAVSGLHVVYDPLKVKKVAFGEPITSQAISTLEIGGAPAKMNQSYSVAMPEGVYEVIDFMESNWGNQVERSDVANTGIEDWRILAQYVSKHSPLDSSLVSRGNRVRLTAADVALYNDEIDLDLGTNRGTIRVRNIGNAPSLPRWLTVTTDRTPTDYADDPNPLPQVMGLPVPAIQPGASIELAFSSPHAHPDEPIYFILNASNDDPNPQNDSTWLVAE